ncbi:C1 family peptidase, partial [bacterium]|nr:C1 family peptidase [bacterium]
MPVYLEIYSDFSGYTGGIYKYDNISGFVGGHFVVIVGWDDSLDCWICKNSWGAGWGENGYFRIARNQVY